MWLDLRKGVYMVNKNTLGAKKWYSQEKQWLKEMESVAKINKEKSRL